MRRRRRQFKSRRGPVRRQGQCSKLVCWSETGGGERHERFLYRVLGKLWPRGEPGPPQAPAIGAQDRDNQALCRRRVGEAHHGVKTLLDHIVDRSLKSRSSMISDRSAERASSVSIRHPDQWQTARSSAERGIVCLRQLKSVLRFQKRCAAAIEEQALRGECDACACAREGRTPSRSPSEPRIADRDADTPTLQSRT